MISYSPEKLIKNVVIFGLGGTGARVASLICQQLVSEEMTKNVRVVLVDGDEVEHKNCRRQLFLPSDVGKNKAEVIAERYRRAFGANIIAVPDFFPLSEDVKDFFIDCSKRTYVGTAGRSFIGKSEIVHKLLRAIAAPTLEDFELSNFRDDSLHKEGFYADKFYARLASGLTVFILAVDSIPARLSILEFISSLATLPNIQVSKSRLSYGPHAGYSNSISILEEKIAYPRVVSLVENLLIIDGGNEDVFGQVNYFHPVQVSLAPSEVLPFLSDRSPYRYKTRVVPMPVGRYLTMKEGESTRRCGDLDQTLSINNLVAANMHLIFQNLFYNNEMTFHMIRFGLNGAYTTEWMSLSWLKKMISTDRDYAFGLLSEEAKQLTLKEGVTKDSITKLNQIDSIRYGYTKMPMSCMLGCSGMFGMLFGPSRRVREGGIPYEGISSWSCGTAIVTDLNVYIKDKVLSAEDDKDVETRLPLFTYTTLLDICWSEMMIPILHKHCSTGIAAEGDKLKLLNLLKGNLNIGNVLPIPLGTSAFSFTYKLISGEEATVNAIIEYNSSIFNQSSVNEFDYQKGTYALGSWFLGYTPVRVYTETNYDIGKLTEHKTYEVGTGYALIDPSNNHVSFASIGANCLS